MICRYRRLRDTVTFRYCFMVIMGVVLVSGVPLVSHPGHEHGPVRRRDKLPEIIVVSSNGCPPCARLAKELEPLRQLAGGRITVQQVYDFQRIQQQYGVTIRAFPTILIIVEGKVVRILQGYHSARDLWNIIKTTLGL